MAELCWLLTQRVGGQSQARPVPSWVQVLSSISLNSFGHLYSSSLTLTASCPFVLIPLLTCLRLSGLFLPSPLPLLVPRLVLSLPSIRLLPLRSFRPLPHTPGLCLDSPPPLHVCHAYIALSEVLPPSLPCSMPILTCLSRRVKHGQPVHT